MGKSALEESLASQIAEHGLPTPLTQYRFAHVVMGREWRADFCFLGYRLLIECDGGTWGKKKSRHTTGSGFRGDAEKHNAAAILGYHVLRFTSDMIHDGTAIETIKQFIREVDDVSAA